MLKKYEYKAFLAVAQRYNNTATEELAQLQLLCNYTSFLDSVAAYYP
jgi:hypothetical protein